MRKKKRVCQIVAIGQNCIFEQNTLVFWNIMIHINIHWILPIYYKLNKHYII